MSNDDNFFLKYIFFYIYTLCKDRILRRELHQNEPILFTRDIHFSAQAEGFDKCIDIHINVAASPLPS